MIKHLVLFLVACMSTVAVQAEVVTFDLQLSGAPTDTFEIEFAESVLSVNSVSFSAAGTVESATYRCTTYDWATGSSWSWDSALRYELIVSAAGGGVSAWGSHYFSSDGSFVLENKPLSCSPACGPLLSDGRMEVIVDQLRDLWDPYACPDGTWEIIDGSLDFDGGLVVLTVNYESAVPTNHEAWGAVKALYR